jgi:predicted transcriptional regulator
MKTGYLVCDVMTQKPISVESNTPVSECSKIMAKYHIYIFRHGQTFYNRDKMLTGCNPIVAILTYGG